MDMENFETKQSIAEKAAAAFGLGMPNPEDIVRREDYKNDAEYAFALARTTQIMQSPEYRKAARAAGLTAYHEKEEETRRKQQEEFKEIKKGIKLSEYEISEIDKEADRIARAKIGRGEVPPSKLGDEIVKIAAELRDKKKDQKANSVQFNAMMRKG